MYPVINFYTSCLKQSAADVLYCHPLSKEIIHIKEYYTFYIIGQVTVKKQMTEKHYAEGGPHVHILRVMNHGREECSSDYSMIPR